MQVLGDRPLLGFILRAADIVCKHATVVVVVVMVGA